MLVKGKILLEQCKQNQLLFEFFMSWPSTKFKLLHLRCIGLKHWAQMIEFLWLTVLLHVLHAGFKHISQKQKPKKKETKKKKSCDNLA